MQSQAHLLNRQVEIVSRSENSKLLLSVLQWNTLARCYTSPKHYPLLPRDVTEMDQRKNLIAQEIKSYNADVICLEEVDVRDLEFYRSIYSKEDYSFSYCKKPHSKDGICILVKRPFELVEEQVIEHTDENGMKQNLVSQLVVAKLVNTEANLNLRLIVTACHLKAAKFPEVRLRQAKQIIEAVEKQMQKLTEAGVRKEDVMVITCGDFNDTPESEPTQEFLKHAGLGLQSAFPEIEYTLFQMYGNRDYTLKLTCDYIFHSNNLTLTKRIGDPQSDLLSEDGLLSQHFPSDHLSLFCELSFQ